MNLAILGWMPLLLIAAEPPSPSFLCQPAYTTERELRLPASSYVPQPGDIFLATDQALWARLGHFCCGGRGLHHSGIVFLRPDGRPGLVEAGPFNSTLIRVMDPYEHMSEHLAAGDCVWIRRRRVPLNPQQSACLTAFICEQAGKPFATMRMLRQITPFRTRNKLLTRFLGKPHGGDRDKYFCSELVVESCVASGLMNGATARPSATYPRDLFYGRSGNPYINRHLDMSAWYPPARWLPPSPALPSPQCTHALSSPQSPLPPTPAIAASR